MFQRTLTLLTGLVLVVSCATTAPAPRVIDVSKDERASINIGKEYYHFTDLDKLHTQVTNGTLSGTLSDQLAEIPKYVLTKVYIELSKNPNNPDQLKRLQYVELRDVKTGETEQVPLFTFNQGYYRTDLVTITSERNAESSLLLTNSTGEKSNGLTITLRLIDRPLRFFAESIPVEVVNGSTKESKLNGVFDTLVILIDGRSYEIHRLFSSLRYPRVIYGGTKVDFEVENKDDGGALLKALESCVEKMKAGTLDRTNLSARYFVNSTDTTYALEPSYTYKENPTAKLTVDFASHDQNTSNRDSGKVSIANPFVN